MLFEYTGINNDDYGSLPSCVFAVVLGSDERQKCLIFLSPPFPSPSPLRQRKRLLWEIFLLFSHDNDFLIIIVSRSLLHFRITFVSFGAIVSVS